MNQDRIWCKEQCFQFGEKELWRDGLLVVIVFACIYVPCIFMVRNRYEVIKLRPDLEL